MADFDAVVVVSGIPRSGTSMMMRMLVSGGVPALLEDGRAADEHNPLGYYECGLVKDLAVRSDFLRGAPGMCVKVVSNLLWFLPVGVRYKVVFMERNLSDVVRSQHAMAGGAGWSWGVEELTGIYGRHLAGVRSFISSRGDIDCLYCRFEDAVRRPLVVAGEVVEFLGLPLDALGMASVVVPRDVVAVEDVRGDGGLLSGAEEGVMEGVLRSLGYL